jgi:hypothetical protein
LCQYVADSVNGSLGEFGDSMEGKSYTTIAELIWSGGDFSYSTGNVPIYTNQTATFVQNPVLDFDLFTFQPMPEQT